MNFYTSDLHFNRLSTFNIEERNVNPLFIDNKGEITIEQMNKVIIERINNTVSSEDMLFILGDCGSAGHDPTKYLKQIKCHKILIIGNHDKKWVAHRHFRNCFDGIKAIDTVKDGNDKIILCHYPMADWENSTKGTWQLYGHIHEYADVPARNFMKSIPHCYNVGVDSNEFKPLTFAEIKERKEKENA